MPLPQDLGELWVNLSMAPAEAGLLPDPPARPASARAPKPLGPAALWDPLLHWPELPCDQQMELPCDQQMVVGSAGANGDMH